MSCLTEPIRQTLCESEWRPSPNFGRRVDVDRPDMLVIHYTAMECAERAIAWLSAPESHVSSHYLIGPDGAIVQMVCETARAWHAGVSHWQGTSDINSRSIGIEISHPGPKQQICPDYSDEQMEQVIALSADICGRYNIPPANVVGHSDIAPHRKQDPGERFDWRAMAQAGAGFWDDTFCRTSASAHDVACGPMLMEIDHDALAAAKPASAHLAEIQSDLVAIGYGVRTDGVWDADVARVIIAFQRHWMQDRVDGKADALFGETVASVRKALAATSN